MARAHVQHRPLGADPAADLVDFLADHGVAATEGPGEGRVSATYDGRVMVLVHNGDWWAHERPTTGETVRNRMQPCGLEWSTARHVAGMLKAGCGVRL